MGILKEGFSAYSSPVMLISRKLVYKCLCGEAPEYLQNLLITYVLKREGLRSEAIINRLIVPRTGKNHLQTELLVLQAPNYGIVC